MNRKIGIITIMLITALLSVSAVLAQPTGAENVEALNSTRYNVSAGGGTPPSVEAQAGNVTQLELNGTAITTSWQGFYGNVSGTLILADSQGNQFYNWSGIASPSGEVYASRSDSVTWASIDCTNSTQVASEETYLGQSATDPDSVTNTYSVTSHPWFLVGSTNATGCPSTKAYDSSGAQGTDFWQVLLNDGTNQVYSTIMSSAAGFDWNPWDFQLLVGENGKPGNEATTPYYFYVELA